MGSWQFSVNFQDIMLCHSVTSLEIARLLANDPKGGGIPLVDTEGEFPGNFSVSYLFFLFMVALEESVGGV